MPYSNGGGAVSTILTTALIQRYDRKQIPGKSDLSVLYPGTVRQRTCATILPLKDP